MDGVTYASIGAGNVTIANNPDEISSANRDISRAQEMDGTKIDPINLYYSNQDNEA